VKRKVNRRINPQAQVLTLDEFHSEIAERDQTFAEKPKRKKPRTKSTAVPILECEDDSDEEYVPKERARVTRQKTVKQSLIVDELTSDDELVPLATSTSDESESEEDTSSAMVHFKQETYSKMTSKVREEKYYVATYGKNLSYVGKVARIGKTTIEMSFLKRLPDNKYGWPSKKTLEAISPSQIICGPISLKGTIPFTILGVDKASADYLAFEKKNMKAKTQINI
jgi:hypothetical protein